MRRASESLSVLGVGDAWLSRSAEALLEWAEGSGRLELSRRGLAALPPSADHYRLDDTVVADLSGNRLAVWPSELADWASLEEVDLSANLIHQLPPLQPGPFALLRFLDLSGNRLEALPLWLFALPALEILLLAENRLETLPPELARLAGTLAELDVAGNCLESLPASLCTCARLRRLSLRANRVAELPPLIGGLRGLLHLDASHNRLTRLPPQLAELGSLRSLSLDGNPLVEPPLEVALRGREHILQWLRGPTHVTAASAALGQGGPGSTGAPRALLSLHQPQPHSLQGDHGDKLLPPRPLTTGSQSDAVAIDHCPFTQGCSDDAQRLRTPLTHRPSTQRTGAAATATLLP